MNFEDLLHKVKLVKEQDLPFVIYRLPNEDHVNLTIQKDRRLNYSRDFKASGFVMAPFDGTKDAVIFEENHIEKYRAPIDLSQSDVFDGDDHCIFDERSEEAKNRHLQLVTHAIDQIVLGKMSKVVLSRSETVIVENIELGRIFRRLIAKYPSAFVYIWFHPEVGLWVGASPETLVRIKGNEFKTMSLAGTQKYNGTVEVSWGDKEVLEQKIVTEHIKSSLKDMSLEVNDTYTRKAGNLLHLCNEISGKLKPGKGISSLIAKLHPTAAVCGLSRKDARDFILSEEGYDRSFYTGFLGELNQKTKLNSSGQYESVESESSLFVNLRCMQLVLKRPGKAVIYIGGGITKDSIPEAEWLETVDKSLIMKKVL